MNPAESKLEPEKELHPDKGFSGSDAKKLAEIESHLESVKPKVMSVDVADQVMNHIQSHKKSPGLSWWNHPVWEQIFNPYPAVRFAVVLFAGVFLGGALTWFLKSDEAQLQTAQLAGSMHQVDNGNVSYAYQKTSFKMIPYQIGNLWYLNFVAGSQDELTAEISFGAQQLRVVSGDFVLADGSHHSTFNNDMVQFTASGMNSYQLIFEHIGNEQAAIQLILKSNNNPIYRKEIILKKTNF